MTDIGFSEIVLVLSCFVIIMMSGGYLVREMQFHKVMLNLEPPIAIPHNTTNCSPTNYTCTDAGGCLEVQGDCNAEF